MIPLQQQEKAPDYNSVWIHPEHTTKMLIECKHVWGIYVVHQIREDGYKSKLEMKEEQYERLTSTLKSSGWSQHVYTKEEVNNHG